jgi:hypothetical protein
LRGKTSPRRRHAGISGDFGCSSRVFIGFRKRGFFVLGGKWLFFRGAGFDNA